MQKVIIALSLVCLVNLSRLPAQGQIPPEPQREQLLNGLRILLWPRPGDKDVLIKLRIHSGGAFDLSGKAGGMAILGDILFPDAATREYFTDEMGGRLDVETDYDSITITMQGRASAFERIVEILRTGVVTTQLTADNVAKIRAGRIKIAKETNISPAVLADRAIAARLFADFPYGRPRTGSAESLARVDRADLLLARERFLNPNNATLAIIGGIQRNKAMRTLRQLLGSWRKSEQIVPATFRQPQAPDARTLIINAPADQSAEVRLASRGLARADRDSAAAAVLASVARKRWEKLVPDLTRSPVFVRHESHVLPGMFVMGTSVHNSLVGKTLKAAHDVLQSLIRTPVSSADLEQSKTEALTLITQKLSTPDGIAEAWVDSDTFGLPPISEQMLALSAVSTSDLQLVATRLFHGTAIVAVVVGDSKQLQAELERHVKVELMGELGNPQPDKSPVKNPATKPD